MDLTIDPVEDEKWLTRRFAQQKREYLRFSPRPLQAHEKLEDISPEDFDKVLFDGQESPKGWQRQLRSKEPSPGERELWHVIVERALSHGDYEHAALLSHEFEKDVLDSLFGCFLMLKKPGVIGTGHLISGIISDGKLCIITLNPKCVAIYG